MVKIGIYFNKDGLSPEDRFWKKVEIDDDGHWHWTGARSIDRGGRFVSFFRTQEGKLTTAHYWAWEHLTEAGENPIVPDTQVRRTCDHLDCVNPAHYRLVHRICDREGCKLAFHFGELDDPIVYHKAPPKAKDLIKNPPTPPAWLNDVLAKANQGETQ